MSIRNWGKGSIITEYQNADAFAHDAIPWTVEDRPLFADDGSHEGLDTGHRAILRVNADGGKSVLGVVGGRYQYLQPQAVLREFVYPFVAAGATPERVTELKGGAKIAIQLDIGGTTEIGQTATRSGVQIRPLLTYADSFDGSSPAFLADICQIVICENTHAMAMVEARGKGATIRHTASVGDRMRLAAAEIQSRLLAFREVETPKLAALYAAPRTISRDALNGFWGAALNADTDSRTVKRVGEIWDRGIIGLTGRMGWDAWNAVTQYLGHEAGRTPEVRAWDTTAGKGARTGADALTLALQTFA